MLLSVYVCLLDRLTQTNYRRKSKITWLHYLQSALSLAIPVVCVLFKLVLLKRPKDEPLQWRWVLALIRSDLWGVVSSWLPDAVRTRRKGIQSSLKNAAASFLWQLYHRLTSEEKVSFHWGGEQQPDHSWADACGAFTTAGHINARFIWFQGCKTGRGASLRDSRPRVIVYDGCLDLRRHVIRFDCMPSPSRSEELLLMEAQQTSHFSSPFVLSRPLSIPDRLWSLNNGRDLNARGLQPSPEHIKTPLWCLQ